MQYKKIRASLKDAKLVLNRTFLIEDRVTPIEFAYILEKMFRMEDSHFFRIEKGKRSFMPKKWTEDFSGSEDLEDISWDDLGRNFRFIYDFGDWWEFDIFVFKRPVSKVDIRQVILLDGAGAGIWEDEHSTFDQFLLDLKLPDEMYGKDWLPWNLHDLDSLKDTMYFNLEAVQKEMDDFVDFDLAGKVSEFEGIGIPEEHFDRFNTIVRYIPRLAEDDPRLLEFADSAYEFFDIACNELKEQGTLPQFMGLLMNEENAPDNVMCLLQELPDIFMDAGRYEELITRMEQLNEMFPADQVLAGFTDGIIFECMLAMKRFDEARQLIEDWKEFYPDTPVIPAARVHLLTAEGKLEEAEKLLNQHLHNDTECNEETYPLFRAAFSLYSITDPKKAEYYSEIIRDFDSAEEDVQDEFHNFTAASKELEFEISRFVKNKSRERYSLACACFVMLCQDDGDVVMHVLNALDPDQSMPMLITSDSHQEFIAVYSTFDAAHQRDYYLDTAFPVLEVIDLALDAEIEGIVVDPDSDGNGLFIHADTLIEIKRVLNEKEAADHHTLFLS